MDNCFACEKPASDWYELRWDSGDVTAVVCDVCVSDFHDIEWIDIEVAPRQKTEISD